MKNLRRADYQIIIFMILLSLIGIVWYIFAENMYNKLEEQYEELKDKAILNERLIQGQKQLIEKQEIILGLRMEKQKMAAKIKKLTKELGRQKDIVTIEHEMLKLLEDSLNNMDSYYETTFTELKELNLDDAQKFIQKLDQDLKIYNLQKITVDILGVNSENNSQVNIQLKLKDWEIFKKVLPQFKDTPRLGIRIYDPLWQKIEYSNNQYKSFIPQLNINSNYNEEESMEFIFIDDVYSMFKGNTNDEPKGDEYKYEIYLILEGFGEILIADERFWLN
ncbi:MAG: hypothetical protein IIA45_07455 [Bacteroidetes bacterium]|nr:hypothetical protein [Bacteroidota bacterium]